MLENKTTVTEMKSSFNGLLLGKLDINSEERIHELADRSIIPQAEIKKGWGGGGAKKKNRASTNYGTMSKNVTCIYHWKQ